MYPVSDNLALCDSIDSLFNYLRLHNGTLRGEHSVRGSQRLYINHGINDYKSNAKTPCIYHSSRSWSQVEVELANLKVIQI